MKVEEPISRKVFDVEAIRIYLPELMKEVNSTTERDERPQLFLKTTKREKTGENELEIVFLGKPKDRHIEKLNYYKKKPEDWTTWGNIVLNPKQVKALTSWLKNISFESKQNKTLSRWLRGDDIP